MKLSRILLIVMSLVLMSCNSDEIEKHTVHVISTGDVHGAWFDEDYSNPEKIHSSLFAVSKKVNDLRDSVGAENVILIDGGDCLQGNVAPYFYNYENSDKPHLFPQIVKYMGYDCVVVGNHDIETSHSVYDKVREEMDGYGIPWLAGNVIDENGDIYFNEYTVVEKAGLKVLILGYTNPNIPEWLQEEKWKGLKFESLLPYVQNRVDEIKANVNPQVTIVAVHSGTGKGDGNVFENQGLDLLNSLNGVDLLITAHDHQPVVLKNGKAVLMNGGSSAAKVGHAVIEVTTKGDKVLDVNVNAAVEDVDKNDVDIAMKETFDEMYDLVGDFTNQKIGTVEQTINTKDAFTGKSLYVDLVNTVMMKATGAQVSFTAPLTYNGTVASGDFAYRDLGIIYPFENELIMLKMKGSEIKGFLEFSYDKWVNVCNSDDAGNPDAHVLKIIEKDDPRNGTMGWAFENKSYNFESAAGLKYTVDITKPFGNRVCINCLANGDAFEMDEFYNVAMTSYRFSGAGDLMDEGAGIGKEEAAGRVVAKYREIRDLISEYIFEKQNITTDMISNVNVLGEWKFIPEDMAAPMLERDMNLLFQNDK
ncbi:MAG: 5'-nucleotidase C-terminal domain-containing protein [Bacteroidales bacterium]|nr:5'-nucleotidase C-terminal domain-containing protein [Bacteroidales bacterium]